MTKRSSLLKIILLVFGFVAFSQEANSTHLMGGSLTYTYLNQVTGPGGQKMVRYRITLKVYRDCSVITNANLDDQIEIAIYNHNPNKDEHPLYTSTFLSLATPTKTIKPPAACNKISYCVEEGIYESTIDLPVSQNGYHLVYKRCCRNQQINLQYDQGQTYYVYIPNTDLKNSSPYFTEPPVPFLCVNDTNAINNYTIDKDGDSLVYKFSYPYKGGDKNKPKPASTNNFYLNPSNNPTGDETATLPLVDYNSGYSFSQPFGNSGYNSINISTGLCKYKATLKGNYSLAVDVFEYRNGKLISSVRRDVQLIFGICPPNKEPQYNLNGSLTPPKGIDGKYYEVEAGNKICFDIKLTDTPSQTVDVVVKGEPLVGSVRLGTQNLATCSNVSGTGGTITTTFCWQTVCNQADNVPYFVTATATDDGCPPKSSIINIFIKVKPIIDTGALKGDTIVCQNKVIPYYTDAKTGYSYDWTVVNGNIKSGQGTNSVNVEWPNAGAGKVIAVLKNSAGCTSTPTEKDVQILPPVIAKPVSGDTALCEFATNKPYSIQASSGSTYKWFVYNGKIISNNPQNSILVNWGTRGTGYVAVVETNQYGCSSDSMYLFVNIYFPNTGPMKGTQSVCPNVPGVEYEIPQTSGSTYYWKIIGGTQSSGGNTNKITVDWGNVGQGFVEVLEINKYGCVGDTLMHPVSKEYTLKGQTPTGDTIVCAFTTKVVYQVNYTNRSHYAWQINGGTITSDNDSGKVTVDWGGPGIANISCKETSFDSVNNLPCFGSFVRLDVRIAPLPSANAIFGNMDFCESSKLLFYLTKGNAGSTYQWSLDGVTLPQTTDTLSLAFPLAGSYTLSFIETTKDNCVGLTFDTIIIVHPKPTTLPITGDTSICYPNFKNHVYNVSGFANSTFDWRMQNGNIKNGQGTNTITVDFLGKNPVSLYVIERSEFGCVGDTISLPLYIDRPLLNIDYVTVGKINDVVNEIYWTLSSAPRYNSVFEIYRRIAYTADTFKLIGTVEGSIRTYTDANVLVNKSNYEYLVRGYDLCGSPIQTNIHTTILLRGTKPKPYDDSLFWTQYFGWPSGVDAYNIMRKFPEDPDYLNYDATSFDTIREYSNGFDSYEQSYRIMASQSGGNYISWSNKVIFNFDPACWIPNAFTPNGDNLNDFFELKGGSLKTFEINIYNRWGEHLFTSNSLKTSWDGKFHNADCPVDVYVYVVKFWGFDNVLQSSTGEIHLIR
ncbi:MAG: gliding motility-associated C-terminal domain-containing protein [Bacteroidota bacterium]|nr:gliding motility-associated C-terminal domain-containing protein [Bacteroidota bacterium]